MPIIAKNIIVVGANTPTTINEEKQELKNPLLSNKINAKNIIVVGANTPTTIPQNKPEPKKPLLSNRNSIQQTTKQLPKYVAKEDGELLTKINTKSQYMRDIFDLDS
jgi:hypothetical protein